MEKAAELLDEAGFPLNEETGKREGIPTLQLYVYASGASELSALVLQESLRDLGVSLNIVIEDNSTYWDHIWEDDVIFFQSGWAAGVPDPSDVFDELFRPGTDQTNYDNPEVTELLDQALIEYDFDARTAIYQQVHDIIADEAVWLPLAYAKWTWLEQPWVDGFYAPPNGVHSADLEEVTIDTETRGF
jgi:peptide/nickel transport system substrate-binding protein